MTTLSPEKAGLTGLDLIKAALKGPGKGSLIPKTADTLERRVQELDGLVVESYSLLEDWPTAPHDTLLELTERTMDFAEQAAAYRIFREYSIDGDDTENWQRFKPRLEAIHSNTESLLQAINHRSQSMLSQFEELAKALRKWKEGSAIGEAKGHRRELREIAAAYPILEAKWESKHSRDIEKYGKFLKAVSDLFDLYHYLGNMLQNANAPDDDNTKDSAQLQVFASQSRDLTQMIQEDTKPYTGFMGRRKEYALNEMQADLAQMESSFQNMARIYDDINEALEASDAKTLTDNPSSTDDATYADGLSVEEILAYTEEQRKSLQIHEEFPELEEDATESPDVAAPRRIYYPKRDHQRSRATKTYHRKCKEREEKATEIRVPNQFETDSETVSESSEPISIGRILDRAAGPVEAVKSAYERITGRRSSGEAPAYRSLVAPVAVRSLQQPVQHRDIVEFMYEAQGPDEDVQKAIFYLKAKDGSVSWGRRFNNISAHLADPETQERIGSAKKGFWTELRSVIEDTVSYGCLADRYVVNEGFRRSADNLIRILNGLPENKLTAVTAKSLIGQHL